MILKPKKLAELVDRMEKSFTQKVREAVIALEQFSVKDLAVFLKYKPKNRHKITTVISYLRQRGQVVSMGPGIYRYQGKQEPLTKVEKMWRAMRIKEYFSRNDIVKLSGASLYYAHKYFSILQQEGFITHVSGRGSQQRIYTITDPDTAPLDRPITSRGWLVGVKGKG